METIKELQSKIADLQSHVKIMERSRQLANAMMCFQMRSMKFMEEAKMYQRIGLVGLAKKRLHQSQISLMAAQRIRSIEHKHCTEKYPNQTPKILE